MNSFQELSKFPIKTKKIYSIEYSYIEAGVGEPIVFLHGFPDHAGGWDQVINRMKGSHTCIAPFLRGYAPTGIPKDDDYSMRAIAIDIHLLVKELGYSKYTVVGHDWGASVAYVMANLFPNAVKAVVALNMPHPAYLKPSLRLLFKARHILYFSNVSKAPGRLAKKDYQYLDTLYKRWSPGLDYAALKEQMVYCLEKDGRKEAVLGYYQQLGKETSENKKIYVTMPQCPTLTLVGKQDGTVVLSQFSKMEANGKFEVKYHPTAGHFLHREQPEYVIDEIFRFIASN